MELQWTPGGLSFSANSERLASINLGNLLGRVWWLALKVVKSPHTSESLVFGLLWFHQPS